jgi:hypothetical protein
MKPQDKTFLKAGKMAERSHSIVPKWGKAYQIDQS